MNKRSFSLALALGVLASLAWTTPSRAEFITTVTLANNTAAAVNDVEMTFAGTGGAITNLDLVAPPGTATANSAGTQVTLDFTAPLANAGSVSFNFESPGGPVTFDGGNWSIMTSNGTMFTAPVSTTRDNVVVTSTVVAEPSSIALLGIGGIGLNGFFALRRFLKRDRGCVGGSRAV